MVLEYCAISEPGLVRKENQDNVYCLGRYRKLTKEFFHLHGKKHMKKILVAVCDGMGGEANGARTSYEVIRDLGKLGLQDGSREIVDYLMQKNEVLCGLIRNEGRRMGSTFCGVLITEENAYVTNIGDSRIFLQRNGELKQLSHDHTSVQTMVDMGLLSIEEAKHHPDRHRLSQHLGIFPEEMVIEPYTEVIPWEKGDVYLLCSDGITDMVDDDKIRECLGGQGSVREKTEELLKEAKEKGGHDNISAIVLKVE